MVIFKRGTPFGDKWYVRGQVAGFTRQAARELVKQGRADYYDGTNGRPKKKTRTNMFGNKRKQ